MAKGNKRNQSVADFPAEFFDIWNLAARRELKLTFATRGTATNFKQRLYTFRKRLLQENPLAAEPFMQVDLQVVSPEEGDNAAKIFFLSDYVPEWKRQVGEAKSKLGITMDPILPAGLPRLPTPRKEMVDTALGDTLKGFGFSSEENKE